MNELEFEIARFLAFKAKKRTRTTYQELGEHIGWAHPTGRGLGTHLYQVLHYCNNNSLPPLTTILVKRGQKFPAPDAMEYITAALGDIDIKQAQKDVFSYDWPSVPELATQPAELPLGRPVWLTSFWGFDPPNWGCIGFDEEWRRTRFTKSTHSGTLVIIYVTKSKGPREMRGKVVGIYEVSHSMGPLRDFVSGTTWAEKESDEESRGKWSYALKATRAWRIAEEDWKLVEELFPKTYREAFALNIGAQGVPIDSSEVERLLSLTVFEVPVYGQTHRIESRIETFSNALSPSKAVYPSNEPYWVGETDGPKHLYILRLSGDMSAYLGRPADELEDKSIIKVGFSKSPLSRRDQIQSAYPEGAYRWEVVFPEQIPEEPPYPNADVAIAGEDAMKVRLVNEGAECLGGEFFLADEWLVRSAWAAGQYAARSKHAGKTGQ